MLISTILIVIIVSMIIGAALSRSPVALTSSSSYLDNQRALLAIDMGVAYAKSRFKEDMNWLGSPDSGPNTIVRTTDNSLVVVEDHGNVVGLVKFDSGQYGQFRIRFNHQDGSGEADGLADPSNDYEMDIPLISANNLVGSAPQSLFEESPDDEKPTERREHLQAFQALVCVEGRAGPGLRDADPYNPNKPVNSLRVVSKIAEARIAASFGDSLDAAAMAAGNIKANLTTSRNPPNGRRDQEPHLNIRSVGSGSDLTPPRVRAKGEVEAISDSSSGETLKSAHGFVNTGTGTLASGTRPDSDTTIQTEDANSDFYNLAWDSIHTANPDPSATDTINLQAGTYVSWRTGSGDSERAELHYYDMGVDDYMAHIRDNPSDPGMVISNDLREVRNNYANTSSNGIRLIQTDHTPRADGTVPSSSLKSQLLIRDDVYVAPTASTDEFNFLPRRGLVEGPPPTPGSHPNDVVPSDFKPFNIQFQFVPRAEGEATFTSSGDITINSRVNGQGGSITSEADIKLVGTGSLSANNVEEGGDGLSLYAKGDIEVNTYRPILNHTEGKFDNFRLNGVVYAWGDINFKLGPSQDDPNPDFYSQQGYLHLRGAVVAYGGDPADATSPAPGSGTGGVGPGRGNININAHYADLAYDTKFLLALDKSATPSSMELLSFTLK